MLEIKLLGTSQVIHEGVKLTFSRKKAMALMAYLITEGEAKTRDHLAGFFWPELDQASALRALRRTLYSLKKVIPPQYLEITRGSLALAYNKVTCDIQQLQREVQSLNEGGAVSPGFAVRAYSGEFLRGFFLNNCNTFEDWRYLQSESLRRDYETLLDGLVHHHEARRQYRRACEIAHRLLETDFLEEENHLRLIRLYANAGRNSAAAKQYRQYHRMVVREWQTEPLPFSVLCTRAGLPSSAMEKPVLLIGDPPGFQHVGPKPA